MKTLLKASALATVFGLAGCAEYNMRELDKAPLEGHAFADELALQYKAMARKESDVYNNELDASHFAVKGLQAATGLEVMPEDPRNWDVPEARLAELMDWRNRLIFAVHKSGRAVDPKLAAETQATYDCAVNEIAEAGDPADSRRCEAAFKDNLVKLEAAVFKESPTFMVHFDMNSANLTKKGADVLGEVAKIAKQLDHHTITVTGNTDGLGGRKFNLILSQKRADVVKAALVQMGLDAKRINAVGGGELSGPEVAPGNRRVDVVLN